MKIKPNVGNDDNGCNDGNDGEPLGLKFFVVGKQTVFLLRILCMYKLNF